MIGRGHTKEIVGLLNVISMHLNTLFDGRSWSYQRSRGVVKCKLYTFKHPLHWSLHLTTRRFVWYDHDRPLKRLFKCIGFTFNNPSVLLV
jgi:hypothetical protein